MSNKTHIALCNRLIALQDAFNAKLSQCYEIEKTEYIVQYGKTFLSFGRSIRYLYGTDNPNLLNVSIKSIKPNVSGTFAKVEVCYDGYQSELTVDYEALLSDKPVQEVVDAAFSKYAKALSKNMQADIEEIEATLNAYKTLKQFADDYDSKNN